MSMRNTPYVEFLRGFADTYQTAKENGTIKDNALYFIFDDESKATATLYLGTTKISSGATAELDILVDNLSLEQQDNGAISLKNYGKCYYQYVPATETESARYTLVDGWTTGLEPRVGENGIEWYEPNTTTVDGLDSRLSSLEDELSGLKGSVEQNTTKLGNLDAGLDARIDQRIAEKAGSILSFVPVEKYEDIDPSAENADKYIYLVPNGNSYEEYIVIGDKIDKIGDTSNINLENYATLSYVNTQISGLNSTIMSLDEYIQEKDNEIISSIEQLNGTIENLKSSNATTATTLESINKSIASMMQNDQTLQDQIDALNQRMSWVSME